MNKICVMVTGAGGAASLGFCRSLREASIEYEIIGVDCNKYHLCLAEADYRYLIPPVTDKDYLDVLNYIAVKHKADFLHSQPDVEIGFLSANREKLKVRTNFPSKETIAICLNKWESYKKWKAAGIKVPKTVFINNVDDLLSILDQKDKVVWLRNIKGAGGKGSLSTADFKEACNWLKFCDGYGKFTAAELLSDKTVTWTSIWDNGSLIVAQTRKRMYWEYSNNSASGVTGLTGTGVTVADPIVDQIAMNSIYAIDSKPNGIFSVDLTYDFDGIPNPTEINIARFFTTHYFFTRAGLNCPDIFVRMSLGLPFEAWFEDLKDRINPLIKDLTWTRGMDTRPVFQRMSYFDDLEEQLKSIKEEIKEV